MTAPAPASRDDIIVVGYDGSPLARLAARWAAARSDRLGATVTMLSAEPSRAPRRVDPLRDLRQAEQARRSGSAVRVTPSGQALREVPPVPEQPDADPAARLIAESYLADLVVIGRHGDRDPSVRTLGEIARVVASRACCPVVLVGNHGAAAPPRRCVVVTDGRDRVELADAMVWAVRFARRAGVPVDLITPWHPGLPTPWESASDLRSRASGSARLRHAAGLRALRALAKGDVAWGGYAIEGDAPAVLARHTDARDLIVTTRGAKPWLGRLVEQAPGTVVVVPPRPRPKKRSSSLQ